MVKSFYRGQRSAEMLDPWRRQYYTTRADATEDDGVLFTIDDAPNGLSAVEVVLWVDTANAYLKAGKLKATAIKLANQAVEDAGEDD